MENVNLMKKKASVAVLSLLLLVPNKSRAYEASISSQGLLINSQKADVISYNIEGSNYYSIRDIGGLLKGTEAEFALDYSREDSKLIIDRNAAYNEENQAQDNVEEESQAILSPQTIVVDGQEQNISFYEINDRAYFSIRDLAEALGFGIDYDSVSRNVLVNTQTGYVAEDPSQVQDAATVESVPAGGENELVEAVEEVLEGPSAYDTQVENMVQAALSYLGTPYRQIDCSTLVAKSMRDAGIDPGSRFISTLTIPNLPSLYEVPMSEMRRGDVLNTTYPQRHAMIYLGDGKVVEAQPKGGIVIRNVRTANYKAYRLVDNTSNI